MAKYVWLTTIQPLRRRYILIAGLSAAACHQVALFDPPPINEGQAAILTAFTGRADPLVFGIARPDQRLPSLPHDGQIDLWTTHYACPLEGLGLAAGPLKLDETPDVRVPAWTAAFQSDGGAWAEASPEGEALAVISRIQLGNFCSASQAEFDETFLGGRIDTDGIMLTGFALPLAPDDILVGAHLFGQDGTFVPTILRGTALLRLRGDVVGGFAVETLAPFYEEQHAGGFVAREAVGGPRLFIVNSYGILEFKQDGALSLVAGSAELAAYRRFSIDGSPDGTELFIAADAFDYAAEGGDFITAVFHFDGQNLSLVASGTVAHLDGGARGIKSSVAWTRPGHALATRIGVEGPDSVQKYLEVTPTEATVHRLEIGFGAQRLIPQGDAPPVLISFDAQVYSWNLDQFDRLPYVGEGVAPAIANLYTMRHVIDWSGNKLLLGSVPDAASQLPAFMNWQYLEGINEACAATETDLSGAAAGARLSADRYLLLRRAFNTRELSFGIIERVAPPSFCAP